MPEPGNPQDLDRYAYVRGNPVGHKDPSGHLTEDEIKGYFGVRSWEEVLAIFGENGALAGRWGWLEVLRQAKHSDQILFGDDGTYGVISISSGEMLITKPGESSRSVSLLAAGRQSNSYRLVRLRHDPLDDGWLCQYCGSADAFVTDAFTKYDRWRPRWHQFDTLGFLLDSLGLLSGGVADDIAATSGKVASDVFQRAIDTADLGYGSWQFASEAGSGSVDAVDRLALATDVAGIFGGPVFDGLGIGLNIWNTVGYYGP